MHTLIEDPIKILEMEICGLQEDCDKIQNKILEKQQKIAELKINQYIEKLGLEIVGLGEIGEISKTSPAAVANWRRRYNDFPTPIADLKAGPIFYVKDIIPWLIKNNKIKMSQL